MARDQSRIILLLKVMFNDKSKQGYTIPELIKVFQNNDDEITPAAVNSAVNACVEKGYIERTSENRKLPDARKSAAVYEIKEEAAEKFLTSPKNDIDRILEFVEKEGKTVPEIVEELDISESLARAHLSREKHLFHKEKIGKTKTYTSSEQGKEHLANQTSTALPEGFKLDIS